MQITSSNIRRAGLAVALASFSSAVFADAFIPTMISANVVWLLVLAPVVTIEGWLMARWKWEKPYKHALTGNVLSILAALPFGVLLSLAGGYVASPTGKQTLSFLSDSAHFFLTQALFYGDTPVPSYGFIGSSSMAGIFFAALVFIGLCWLLTFMVEGYYYSRKNPSRPRIEIFRRTALVNVASYCFLIALWLPYSYYSASAAQGLMLNVCAQPSSWSSHCTEIWEKFPEVRELRLASCGTRSIPEQRCLGRSN